MKKELKEFTKEDWDRLFPVSLDEHKPEWKLIFEEEKQKITQSTGKLSFKRIEHFGSSSIPGIKSKPYIDILMEVPGETLFTGQFAENLENIGYTCLTEPNKSDDTSMIFIKGYHRDGSSEQIFHLHACATGHPMLRQIAFRDYLLAKPERAKAYERLKIRLASQFKNDRSGYRMAKTEFITETLKMAEENSGKKGEPRR